MNRAESTWDEHPRPGPSPEAEVPVLSWAVGVIRLRDPRLFAPHRAEALGSFLQRIFRLDEVRSVEIDRAVATATIDYAPEDLGVAEALARMAGAIGRVPGTGEALPDVPSLAGVGRL